MTKLFIAELREAIEEEAEEILDELIDEGKRVIRDEIEGTWRHNYEIKILTAQRKLTKTIAWGQNRVKRDLSGKFAPIPFYLSEGAERKVAMTPGFLPKTTPGRLRSSFGGGDPEPRGFLKSGSAMIEPRNYDEQIGEALEIFAETL